MMSLKDERMNQITGTSTTKVSAMSAEVLTMEEADGGLRPETEVQVDFDLGSDLVLFNRLIPRLAFFPPKNSKR